jgi:hypothetical protein
MGISSMLRLSLFFLVSTSQAMSLAPRQAPTCGGVSGLSQCGTGFPSSFCCPTNSECQPFKSASSSATSVICCPKGTKCDYIQPVTCDVGQYNAELHPDSQIHLDNSTAVTLPKCGDQCCPVGFSCSGGMCKADASSTSSSASGSPTPSPVVLPTSSTTSTASASQTALPVTESKQGHGGFSGGSFAGGFFTGLAIGALLVVTILWFIKRRRESQWQENHSSSDLTRVARTISDPIYNPTYGNRTDFIRRGSQSVQPTPQMQETPKHAGGLTPRIKSLWDRTPRLAFGGGGFTPLPSDPKPPPPIRAGSKDRDPYKTPSMRTNSIQHTPSTASTHYQAVKIGKAKYIPQPPARSQSSSQVHTYTQPQPHILTHQNSNHTQNQNQNSNANHRPPPPPTTRSRSSETIDILMRPPSFLAPPPQVHGSRENRFTTDSNQTTFTKLMERAGYEEGERSSVRDWRGTPKR